MKTDSKNKDSLNLIVSDVKGYYYIYNINKNILVNQFKIHEAPIVNFKISSKINNNNIRTLIYSLDKNSTIKILDLATGEIIKNFKLLKDTNAKILFDIDNEGKYIVFSKGSKIKLLSLESFTKSNNSTTNIKNFTTKIGMHSQEITSLSFSSDSKFILSSTMQDYVISVWHLKNKDVPLFTIQNTNVPIDNYMLKINKGIYHAISVSRQNVSVYKIDLKDVDPNEPLKALFSANFSQSNLIGLYCGDIATPEKKDILEYDDDNDRKKNEKIFSVFYGNQFKIERKNICYSEKSDNEEVKKEEIKIIFDEKAANKDKHFNSNNAKSNTKNVVVKSNKFKILNEIEMSKNEINDDNYNNKNNQQGLILVENNKNNNTDTELTTSDTKISLLNIIRNSLINNDINQFEWALDQKVFNFFFIFNKTLFIFYQHLKSN